MRDKTSNDRLQLLHPAIRQKAIDACNEADAALTGKAILRIAYTLRTFAEQSDLYAQGRTKAGKIVTNAKAGYSYHNFAFAFDIVLLIDRDNNGTYETASWQTDADLDADGKADWMEVVEILKKHGFVWGGDFKSFKDLPHFEMTLGYTTAQLRAMKKDNKGYVVLP